MSVYVDSAATGAADGTSWTDAFTTIQAAIDSLPTVMEHAVTIYVRKGASAYADNISIQQIVGKGSLTIEGEYYWSGPCAAAASPATDVFQVPDTTGIVVGDLVCIVKGNTASASGGSGAYQYYNYTTVESVDSGTQLTLVDACDWGNIDGNSYYRIVRTAISGTITVANTQAISLIGISTSSTTNVISNSVCTLSVYFASDTITCDQQSTITFTASYVHTSTYSVFIDGGSTVYQGIPGIYGSVSVFTGKPVFYVTGLSRSKIYFCIMHGIGSGARAVYSIFGSSTGVYYSTIAGPTAAPTPIGLDAEFFGSIYVYTYNNLATTPLVPATSTDPSYIRIP
jgi:hypothetical protein